jgi:hypothetical protein
MTVISGDTHTHLAFQNSPNTAHNTYYHVSLLGNVYVHSPADNISLPSRVPIHSNNEARPKKHKLLAQISYQNQFATAIVTSTGDLIAALKAREVEMVSQGWPFNRIG